MGWLAEWKLDNIILHIHVSFCVQKESGVDPGGGCTQCTPPLKIGKNMIFWRKIVIFTRNTSNIFGPPPTNLKSWIRPWKWYQVQAFLNPTLKKTIKPQALSVYKFIFNKISLLFHLFFLILKLVRVNIYLQSYANHLVKKLQCVPIQGKCQKKVTMCLFLCSIKIRSQLKHTK
jgi:hypothetical protein